MKTIQALVKRHSLLTYLVLAFAISWGGVLGAVGPGEFPPGGERFYRMILFGYMGMLAGPSVAGLLLTGLIYGKAGFRELLSRVLKWRLGARWYAIALLTAPLAIATVLLSLGQIAPEFMPRLLVEEDKLGLVVFSGTAGLLVGIFEELGWTGFVVHTLLKRGYGVLWTGLIAGFLFAAWNALVVFGGSGRSIGTLPPVVYLPLVLFTWQPVYRILMVWVYERTGSLLLAMLMQASLVMFWTNLTPVVLSGMSIVTYYLVLTAILGIVIAAFTATNRRQLPRRPFERAV